MTTPKIVTICRSMKFFDQMLQVAAEETAKGHIVLAPFCVVGRVALRLLWDHGGPDFTDNIVLGIRGGVA